MRRDRYLLGFIIILLLVTATNAQINQTTDITTNGGEIPTIHDIWFGTGNAINGQNITIYANISDVDGVSYADAGIYNSSGDELDRFTFSYNSSSGLFYTSFLVDSNWSHNGTIWIGDSYVEDSLTYGGTVNGTFLNGTGFTSPSLNIDQPSIVHDIWFDRTKAIVGENVTVYGNFSDPDGISYADSILANSNKDQLDLVEYTYYNSTSGLYQGYFEVQSSWTHNGSLWLADILIEDNQGNSLIHTGSFYDGSDFKSPELKINTSSSVNSQINDIFFDPSYAQDGESVKIKADVSDLDGVSKVGIGLYNSTSNFVSSTNLTYNSSSSYYETKITVQSNWLHNGTLWIGDAIVEDSLNNTEFLVGSFLGGSDFNSPELHINYPTTVNDFWFDKSHAQPGENITIFGDISDPEGIVYADVGLFNSQSDLVHIVKFTYYNSTSGFYQGYFKANSSWSQNGSIWIGDAFIEDKDGMETYFEGSFLNGSDFYSESIQIDDTSNSDYIEINLSILSSPLTTNTNESFGITLKNHFNHSKNNLSLEALLHFPNGTIYQQYVNSSFTLDADEQYSTDFTFVFDKNGTYLLEIVVNDNLNQSWYNALDFDVVQEKDDDTGDNSDGEETNSTSSVTNTTEGVQTPNLELPVTPVWIGLSFIVTGIIIRGKRK